MIWTQESHSQTSVRRTLFFSIPLWRIKHGQVANQALKIYIAIDRDYTIPSHITGIAPEKASAILQQFDRKKRAAAITVPTDDARVRSKLRELGEPITLFGEGRSERRDRLRALLAARLIDREEDGEDVDMDDQSSEGQNNQEVEEEFYTPGLPELLDARRWIAGYSLERAKQRIQLEKSESTVPLQRHVQHRKSIKERLVGYNLMGSQIAGDRPVSIARFSPDSKMIAAGNWSGGIKLYSVPNLEETKSLRGHTDRVGGIAWAPTATLDDGGLSPESVNLVSGGGEGDVHLWNLVQDTPVATLSGHSNRVCRVEYHPSGKYVGSASYDTTWRLWDLETTAEIQLQEGHSREVYAISFQNDGALVATGGLDAIGRVWDIRTGRTIMVLDGHIRDIFGLSFAPNGYQVISAAGDATAKVWDIRKVRCISTIGAHTGLVSDVRFFDGGVDTGKVVDSEVELGTRGKYFVTGGFDKKVNVSLSSFFFFAIFSSIIARYLSFMLILTSLLSN